MKNTPITLINYSLNKNRLIEIANELKGESIPYYDSRYDQSLDTWKIARLKHPEINRIMMDFGVFGKARFYWTEPNSEIPVHTDNGTECSLNFVLSDGAAPVNIEGEDYYYEQCLLNTTVPHGVKNGDTERLLLKISIFNETYEEVLKRLKYKKEM